MKTITKIIIVLFICVYSIQCFSKNNKMYIWKPNKYEMRNITHFSDTIYISIIDDRELSEKSKIKFSSEDLVKYTYDVIKKSFPNATIITPKDEKDCGQNLYFKIHIKVYCAMFNAKITVKDLFLSPLITGGSSKWYGTTQYLLEIVNDKDGTNKIIEFQGEDSHNNIMGYSTAKKTLTNSFQIATDNLINYLITAIALL